jgi:hypothetical protein|tara:strand:+ start:497 stop:883 length:387 start_codon:yes stop_codon:yes gene_type:complete
MLGMKKRMKRGGTAKKKTAKKFPDMSGDGKVTKKDILIAKGVIKKPGRQPRKKQPKTSGNFPDTQIKPDGTRVGMRKGGDTHVTKDGRTVKKGLYYYMNRAKKKGTSRKGKGTVTDKALKRSAKTAKK